MNKIMNFVGQHGYYYLTGQGYNTYFKKLKIVYRVSTEEYIYAKTDSFF